MSILLSLSRDLNLVQKIPAAENARSASTEVGGIVSSQLYTVCRHLPRVPELLNSAISALMAAISFFPALYSAAALLVDGVGDGSIVINYSAVYYFIENVSKLSNDYVISDHFNR